MATGTPTIGALDLVMPSRKKNSRSTFRICVTCGRRIHKNSINLEKNFDGKVYRFDSESCLLIFRKLRDVYGKNFFKPRSRPRFRK